VSFGDVGGCSGDDKGVNLAVLLGEEVKKSKCEVISLSWRIFDASVAHKRS
jgi:hypothetical protein